MEKGDYIILFTTDVHRPGIAEKEPQTYRKAVVKVSMDLL
jgi:beta-galactosidase beta subunit